MSPLAGRQSTALCTAVLAAAVLTAACSVGCTPAPPPPVVKHVEPDPRPAPPNPRQIKVQTAQRLVELYELPAGGQWWATLPGATAGQKIDRQYRVPADVNIDSIEVYYTLPGYGPQALPLPLSAAVREP